MKRYLVFGGEAYYPAGGWGDFLEDADDLKEVVCILKRNHTEWFQIVDTETMKEIEEGESNE